MCACPPPSHLVCMHAPTVLFSYCFCTSCSSLYIKFLSTCISCFYTHLLLKIINIRSLKNKKKSTIWIIQIIANYTTVLYMLDLKWICIFQPYSTKHRVRRMKQKVILTEIRRQTNRMTFGEVNHCPKHYQLHVHVHVHV